MLDLLRSLLADDGYGAVFLVLFLNNLGLPVPGNTLLLGAGFLVGTGVLSFWPTAAAAAGAAFMGTNCSYWLGRRYGRPLLEKNRWLRLTHQRVRHMEHFFQRYGSKGVFFARFVALLHPFIGILAGVGKAPGRSFFFYNLAGSAAYALLFTGAGAVFGPKWGFHEVWKFYSLFYLLLLGIILVLLSHFWRHDIYTFFGHPFYKKKRKGFWRK